MKASELQEGDFITNETFVRELISLGDDGYYYLDYTLSDGAPIGQGICSPESLARWAKRCATAEEIDRMDRAGARSNIVARERAAMFRYVHMAPTWLLEQELLRRRSRMDDPTTAGNDRRNE
jgi:hypothetical protein